uniref:Uncharacterized protein n=1 Tax=Ciona intestinalis TaxID=7719 RepID=H2XJS7_CIOIN
MASPLARCNLSFSFNFCNNSSARATSPVLSTSWSPGVLGNKRERQKFILFSKVGPLAPQSSTASPLLLSAPPPLLSGSSVSANHGAPLRHVTGRHREVVQARFLFLYGVLRSIH